MDPSRTNSGATKPAGESSDEQLMRAFSRGSTDAFSDLFARYKQPLFGFFWRRVADRAQAEELTQEAFFAVIRAARRYEPSARFRTYLYAIALKILRAYRRKTAFRATFLGTPPEHAEPAAESGVVTQLLIREALRNLDAMDREMLLLREFEQLSYAEIAELLNLPVNTVRSRLFRARTALRELLSEKAPSNRREMRRPEEGI
jgi:RNA polymerase sigma-70 factor (ECF subfamily)